MTRETVESPFTLKRVQEMLGLSPATVSRLISAGFVAPTRGRRNELRFSFQDLMLLRTAHGLRAARIPPRKIIQSLAKLKAELPDELPLTGLRITAVGTDVVVRDRSGQWNPESGQLVMDFEVAEVGGIVAILHTASAAAGAPIDQDDWFKRGEALEPSDRAAAEKAYRRAIAQDPARAAPYLNLGALLCEDNRCGEAIELYASALEAVGHEPLIHFNHAIALEDASRPDDAVMAYERAIALDSTLADAHYNAGMLRERMGEEQAALKHFSAYRRLSLTEGR